MSYVALYRRFRPQGFSELVGQEAVRRTLEQAIVDGRVAHAYLFAGPRGTGKTSTAKIMARLLNCEQPVNGEPCGKCENCRQITDGTSMDVYEIDAASNRGIDEIRELRDTVKFAATGGLYKVYIVDEVHMLTTEAFNALLKTLEEPPEKVVFILATTEPHKVPTTIKSRCQRYDFKRIPAAVIEARLQDVAERSEISITREALSIIAREADGGMRDALSIMDQCVTLCSGTTVTAELVNNSLGIVSREAIEGILTAIGKKNPVAVIDAVGNLLSEGKDLKQLIVMLQAALRRTMVYQAVGENGFSDISEEEIAGLERLAKLFSPDEFIPLIEKLHDTLGELRWTEEPRLAVESALLTLSSNIAIQPGTKVVFQPVSTVASNAPFCIATPADSAAVRSEMALTSDEMMKQAETVIPSAAIEGNENMRAASELKENTMEQSAMAAKVKAAEKTVKPTAKKADKVSKRAAFPDTNDGEKAAMLTLSNSQEARQLWERLIASVRDAGNSSLVSCLGQGEPEGMTDSFIRVRFASSFVKGRTEKADFRRKIEDILREIVGKPITYVAVTVGDKGTPRKKKKEKTDNRVSIAESIPAMRDAMKIFGTGSMVEVVPDLPPVDEPFPDDDDMPTDNEEDFL